MARKRRNHALAGLSEPWRPPPQNLVHQLTLSHPGGQIMPTTLSFVLLLIFRIPYASAWPAELLWNPLFEFLLNA